MSPRFSLTYYDPPERLARHVLAYFHFIWEDEIIEDRHPGALGQLVMFPRGAGEMQFPSGTDPVRGDAYVFCGFTTAVPFRISGPWHVYGASLSPLGWAALTDTPAPEFLDRIKPAETLLGPDISSFAHGLNTAYRAGEIDGKEACDRLSDWIEPRLRALPPRHEKLIETTLRWIAKSLYPDVDDLFANLAYSRRQAERLVERYFGFPPASLARKFRAVRASALLAKQDLTDEEEAQIAEAFYDQPHMVREIRRFCGYTPSRLGGPSDPILQVLLQLKNFNPLRHFTD